MAKKKYLDEHGLSTLIGLIKESVVKIYKVKGSVIYADAAYLADPNKHSDIDSVGIWQLIDGAWIKITEFEVGWVYNIENEFTTDASFVEGAGSTVEAGSNIVVAEAVDNAGSITYKWDQLGNVLDLTDYQPKRLITPINVFSEPAGTAAVYASEAALPASEAKATATITTYDVAILGGVGAAEADIGRCFRAVVTENASDATLNDIAWVEIGDQISVEGALKFLASVCPNTPISDDEIRALFNA